MLKELGNDCMRLPCHPQGALKFAETLAEAVEGVQLIQESLPEKLELKRSAYRKLEAVCRIRCPDRLLHFGVDAHRSAGGHATPPTAAGRPSVFNRSI